MKLIACGKQGRADPICILRSPRGCHYLYSFAEAKLTQWQEREQLKKKKKKKDDMKMIEPQTIELGSIHLRD